ncbi:MAG: 50S ribosome-binding GTPase [Selenomonadaceae bacterium]|nr:50S ribosome-binding GTPase [Selenomonadaceae bacterium]
MYELKDYQSILGEKAARVQSFFEKYPKESSALAPKFFETNEKKIRSTEPEIMVYGIYNAGKSSILNELMGADRAAVNDIPTTDSVTYYEWQGYKIADTPGIFAPIAHEQVTQNHLQKADIVLFVMSTTGSNEKAENYQRMKEIADAGKKIIIVLNDKNGDMGRNDENIQVIKRQVAVNMQKVGIDNVDEKYCIVTVNAARAKKGRTENKKNLLAKSGLDELKNIILTELKSTTSFEILRGGIRQIENILEEFIKNLEGNENSELIKNMNRVLESFNKQKISIRRQINTYIDTQAEFLGNNLPQIIWAKRDNQDQINQVISDEISRLNEKIQREIKRHLTDAASILELELQSFAEIKLAATTADAETFKNILAQLNNVNVETKGTEIVPQNSDKTDLSTIGLAGGLITESAGAIAANLAKTEIGKAIAKTAIGKLIGGAIPVIGPILTIVGVLGALLGGGNDREKVEAQLQARNEQERRRVEAEMQARQELNQKCLYLADNIADELKTAADNGISEALAKYEEPFKKTLAERQTDNEKLSDDIVKLREIFNEYDLICVELGAK